MCLVFVEVYFNVICYVYKDKFYLLVLICLEVKDNDIVLEIWDYGEGFDIGDYSLFMLDVK